MRGYNVKAIISVLAISITLSARVIRADDDTLRDLGPTAAPGEIPKWDGAQWRNAHDNIATVNAGAGLSGTMTNGEITLAVAFNTNGASNVVSRADHIHPDLNSTRPPVGAVVAWLKSYPNTPTSLPNGWVEANGQVLDDTDSIYHSQTIPNLNGAAGQPQRFLRGAPTSGTVGGTEIHNHGIADVASPGGNQNNFSRQLTPGSTDNRSTLPSYYEVVWIMRVK